MGCSLGRLCDTGGMGHLGSALPIFEGQLFNITSRAESHTQLVSIVLRNVLHMRCSLRPPFDVASLNMVAVVVRVNAEDFGRQLHAVKELPIVVI